MNKISSAQIGQMTKLASAALRTLSERNQSLEAETNELRVKVASYERRAHAEKIASQMHAKGIDPSTSLEEKVASLIQRDNLEVVEEAVSMSSPQMKVASIVDGGVIVDGTDGAAEANFAASLASF